jgi:hypothetical protein
MINRMMKLIKERMGERMIGSRFLKERMMRYMIERMMRRKVRYMIERMIKRV